MSNLTRAHHELFQRSPDERFASLRNCKNTANRKGNFSSDCWHLPQSLEPKAVDDRLTVRLGDDGAFLMNDWSFSQLCRLSGVTKGTFNRLSPRHRQPGFAARRCRPRTSRSSSWRLERREVDARRGLHPAVECGPAGCCCSEFATNFQPPPDGRWRSHRVV
jgi:hypothetical protein